MAFDVISPALFARAEIPTTIGTLRTVPANSVDFVKNIDVSNTNSTSATVSLYLVPATGSEGVSNCLIPSVVIPGKSIFQWTGAQIVEAGSLYRAVSSSAGVSIHISGGNGV